jgi:Na+/citrate or Na+/malate symporter
MRTVERVRTAVFVAIMTAAVTGALIGLAIGLIFGSTSAHAMDDLKADVYRHAGVWTA